MPPDIVELTNEIEWLRACVAHLREELRRELRADEKAKRIVTLIFTNLQNSGTALGDAFRSLDEEMKALKREEWEGLAFEVIEYF